jgi:hypothetical protein
MFIKDQPQRTIQARSSMFKVHCMATTVLAALLTMPLLAELDSSEVGFCYRHGAPSGALFPSQYPIPPQTAKNPFGLRKLLALKQLWAYRSWQVGCASHSHRF